MNWPTPARLRRVVVPYNASAPNMPAVTDERRRDRLAGKGEQHERNRDARQRGIATNSSDAVDAASV